MSRGAGFSDTCAVARRSEPDPPVTPIVDRDAIAARVRERNAIEFEEMDRTAYQRHAEAIAGDEIRRTEDLWNTRQRVLDALPENQPVPPVGPQRPQWYEPPARDAGPTPFAPQRTPVEDGPIPLGTTDEFGGGRESAESMRKRQTAAEREAAGRTVDAKAYGLERRDFIARNYPPGLTVEQRAAWDAPFSDAELLDVMTEVQRLETQTAAGVEARIRALDMDPNGSGATIMRLSDAAMRQVQREESISRAFSSVRSARIKGATDNSVRRGTGPNASHPEDAYFPVEKAVLPDTALEGVRADADTRAFGSNPESPITNRVEMEQMRYTEDVVRDGEVIHRKGDVIMQDGKPKVTPIPAGRKVASESKKAQKLKANRKQIREERNDQREVVNGELKPPRASKPKPYATRGADPKSEQVRTLAAAALEDQGLRPLTGKQRTSLAEDIFETDTGSPPEWRVQKEFGKPDKRVYTGTDKKKMDEIFAVLDAEDAKRLEGKSMAKYSERQQPVVDNFVAQNGREPTRIELDELMAPYQRKGQQ